MHNMTNVHVIIRPVITERSMRDANSGKFTFLVGRDSDKNQIKKIIEQTYNVHVVSVVTVTTKGKVKRVGTRRVEKTMTPVKKAVVGLKSGEKIGLFDIEAK